MMRLPPFTYLAPVSVGDAVKLIADHGPEAMLAGAIAACPPVAFQVAVALEIPQLTRAWALVAQGTDIGRDDLGERSPSGPEHRRAAQHRLDEGEAEGLVPQRRHP